jgi:acetolactate synthase-1/2/3 large subunit
MLNYINKREVANFNKDKIPIKILLMNNNAYGANVITQNLYFKNKYGSDIESGISFPKTEKIANAYGIKYMSINKNDELNEKIKDFLNLQEAVICEIFCSIQQRTPKLSSIKNDDGSFVSKPYEDMEPFLSREEFTKEMIVKTIS